MSACACACSIAHLNHNCKRLKSHFSPKLCAVCQCVWSGTETVAQHRRRQRRRRRRRRAILHTLIELCCVTRVHITCYVAGVRVRCWMVVDTRVGGTFAKTAQHGKTRHGNADERAEKSFVRSAADLVYYCFADTARAISIVDTCTHIADIADT